MPSITIYHNPRCTKSRATLELLRQHGEFPTIVEHLETPPSVNELTKLLAKLRLSAAEMVRKGEASYLTYIEGKSMSERQLIETMVEHPELIERPIIVMGDRAIIGRPPENVFELFK